jgi:lipoprotein releasing system ATP-binding protein
LACQGLSKIYRQGEGEGSEVRVLQGVDLEIRAGERIAIVGASGSGKSTLLHLLGGLDSASSGKVQLMGRDLSEINDAERGVLRNRHLGFVYQFHHLLPEFTALENVMLPLIYAGIGKAKRIELAKQTLLEVKLGDRMEHRPNELSGGQRQRVAIARALVNNPAIILADEPTGNLDSKTSVEILGLLEEIHKMGNTVIIVTHEEDIAQHAHRIIRLMDGKINVDEENKNIKTISDYHFNEVKQ